MGHYERVRCDNCNGTGTVGQYSGEGPKQCWSCGGTGYKGDVWVEDSSSSSSSSYDSGSSSGGYSGGGGSSSRNREEQLLNEAVMLYNAGNYDQAIIPLTRLIDGYSNAYYVGRAYSMRAACYIVKRGNWDQAIDDATNAINKLYDFEKYLPDAYNRRGAAYNDGKGNKQQAIADWKEAAYLGNTDAKDNLAKNGVQYSLVNHIEEKIANNINSPSYVWNLADKWEHATGRKMNKDEQVRIAGKPFPKRPKPSSSSSYSSSSYGEDREGHPTLFGIIGAVVLGGIGYSLGRFIGLVIGGIAGWFLGRKIGSKISFGGGSSSHIGIGSKLLGVLFGIIGAAVLTVIVLVVLTKLNTAGMVNLLGLLGGPIVGFILGWKISGTIIGKLLLIAALIGGGLFFGKSYLAPYLSKGKTPTEIAATAATVTRSVNFRAEPSTEAAIIRQLQQGDSVTLTGKTNGGWTQVKHGSDVGWVSSEFLKK